MKPARRYTVAEIKGCIDMFREDKEISQEKIAGMDFLVEALAFFERFDDLPDAKKSLLCRNVHREWDREKTLEKMATQEAKEARKKKKLEKMGK